MKYLVAKFPGELPVAVLFSPYVAHLSMAERMSLRPSQVLSAGFCRIDADGVEVSGFSTSLGCGPAAGDAALIQSAIEHTNREYPARPQVRPFTGRVTVEAVSSANG